MSSYGERDFELLFQEYWNKVYGMCARYCRDEEVAKDLTQDIFLSLWQRDKTFADRESLERYLSKSAKYRVIAHYRDGRMQNEHTVPISESLPVTDFSNPEAALHFKQFSNIAQTAIKSLPEPSRTIFLLNREQEMTYGQIAAHQGLSLKSIEFHISKALRLLRKSIRIEGSGL